MLRFCFLIILSIIPILKISATTLCEYDSIMTYLAEISSDKIIELADSAEKSDTRTALVMWLTLCHRFNDQLPDDEIQRISYAHLRAGNIHYSRNNYTNALELFIKGLKISEQSKAKRYLMHFYNNIGNVYSVFEEYEKGINYFNKGLEIWNGCPEESQSAYNILVNITGMHAYLNNTEKAKQHYLQLMSLKGFNSPEHIFMKQYDLGLIKKCENKPEESISIFKDIAVFANKNNLAPRYECSAYEEIYKIYYSLDNYDSTLVYLDKCARLTSKENIQNLYPNLKKAYSKVFEAKGDIPKALQYKSEYLDIKDSIYNQREFEIVKNQQFLYEIEQTENKITSMNEEKQQHLNTIKNQRRLISSILTGVLVVCILLTIVWIQKQRLKASYEKLYIAHRNALNETPRINTSGNISSIANQGNNPEMPPGQIKDEATNSDAEGQNTPQDTKYQNSNLSISQKKCLAEAINLAMEQKRLYCNSDFSLEQLATEVGSNSKYVSQVINEVFGKNFSNYINEYRVRLVCLRLLDKEQFGHLTIKAISEMSGFKSQSTFIKVFRNIVGMPPSMYQRLAKNDNLIPDSRIGK